MHISEFIQKWRGTELTEKSASHEHFIDLCRVFDHPTPAEQDQSGKEFTFEKGATKPDKSDGWADIWKRDYFAWEYKSPGKDLEEAYKQLQRYEDALENPPLLVVCDMDRFIIRTKFTNMKTEKHEFSLLDLREEANYEILRSVFHEPERLKPGRSIQAITQDAAGRIGDIAQDMRGRDLDPQEVARFLDRLVFCLFAEDIGLLPDDLVSRSVRNFRGDPKHFHNVLEHLFDAMADGDVFGPEKLHHFDGSLFRGEEPLEMTRDEIDKVYQASRLDWSQVDPSIFGTLFERGMDPEKRSQIGAHYTGREDIETLVEPVVMWPLRREWDEIKETVENLLTTGRKSGEPRDGPIPKQVQTKARNEGRGLVRKFHNRLTQVTVLDPACGSGNFLYVTLQLLKGLEKEVIIYAADRLELEIGARVGPWQLYGIEKSPYAHELAQMVVWIGYLQWQLANGYPFERDPVLRPLDENITCRDAILDLEDPDDPREPDWPKVDYIVGNPPFLGNRHMPEYLPEQYLSALWDLYEDRLGGKPDLCCYWFERARRHMEQGNV